MTNKTVYFVYVEDNEFGEVEGAICDDEVIGYWWNNDANWRNDYFSGFMKKLGITTKHSASRKHVKMLLGVIRWDQGGGE